jgi:hypothetical protein
MRQIVKFFSIVSVWMVIRILMLMPILAYNLQTVIPFLLVIATIFVLSYTCRTAEVSPPPLFFMAVKGIDGKGIKPLLRKNIVREKEVLLGKFHNYIYFMEKFLNN